jgi:hypothetical protein
MADDSSLGHIDSDGIEAFAARHQTVGHDVGEVIELNADVATRITLRSFPPSIAVVESAHLMVQEARWNSARRNSG